MSLTKTGGISHNHLNDYFFLQHISDLLLHIELDSTLSKVEGIYHQLTLAVQLPDVARKINGLEPVGEHGGGEEQESVQMGIIDKLTGKWTGPWVSGDLHLKPVQHIDTCLHHMDICSPSLGLFYHISVFTGSLWTPHIEEIKHLITLFTIDDAKSILLIWTV